MKFVVLCLLVATLASIAEGKKWGMCELARKMHDNGFPRSQLDDWMCLVSSESSYKQDAIGRLNPDGSKDWGLFQISDIYWCQDTDRPGQSQNICRMTCQSFLHGDISQNLKCVKKVYEDMRKGFSAWMGWNAHCQGELPDTKPCFESGNKTTSSSRHHKAEFDRGAVGNSVGRYGKEF